jgi:hypothetical protein
MTKEVKKRKTFELRLTKFELLHLRDLFSVVLPPDVKKTLSQSLAELEERPLVETMLWNKVSEACDLAGIPTGPDAPDYVISINSPPGLGVFQLASEPMSDEDEEGGGLPFIKSDEEE